MPQVVSAGAWLAGTTSVTPALPSGLVVGNLLLLLCGGKPQNVPTVTAGWTKWNAGSTTAGGVTDGTLHIGTTSEAQGADTGPGQVTVWWRKVDGTETAPTVSQTSGSPTLACIVQVGHLASETTDRPITIMEDGGGHRSGGAATNYSNFSLDPLTTAQNEYTTKVDDLIVTYLVATGNTTFSSPGIRTLAPADGSVAAGTTAASTAVNSNLSTTTGNDGAAAAWKCQVTGGGTRQRIITDSVMGTAEWLGGYALLIRAAQPALAQMAAPTAVAGEDQIALSWTASTGAVAYAIYRDDFGQEGKANGPVKIATVTPGTATSFTDTADTGLGAPDYFRDYTITAINADGIESFPSAATRQTSLIGRPVDVRMYDFTTTSVRVAHYREKAYDATYRVYLDGVLAATRTNVDTFPFEITGLVQGGTYLIEFETYFVNEFGATYTSPRNAITHTTKKPPVIMLPATPGQMTNVNGDIGDTKTTDPNFVKHSPSTADVGDIVRTDYLVEPDKTKYLEVIHESSFGKSIYVWGPLIDDLIPADQVLDGTLGGIEVACYIEFVKGLPDDGCFLQFGTALPDGSGFDTFTAAGMNFDTAAERGSWVSLTQPLTWIPSIHQLRGRRIYFEYVHQGNPDANAATGSLVARIYALAVLMRTKDPIAFPADFTASRDRVHQVRFQIGQQAEPLFNAAGAFNRTDDSSPNASTIAYLTNADPIDDYGTHPILYGPDEIRGYVYDKHGQRYGGLDGKGFLVDPGVPLPGSPGLQVLRSGPGELTVRVLGNQYDYRTLIYRSLGATSEGFVQVADLAPGVYEYVDTGLTIGASYRYRARSYYPKHDTTSPLATAGGVVGKAGRLHELLPSADIAASEIILAPVVDDFNRPDALFWGDPWSGTGYVNAFNQNINPEGVQILSNQARGNTTGAYVSMGRPCGADGEMQVTWVQKSTDVQGMHFRGGYINGAYWRHMLRETGDLLEPTAANEARLLGNIGAIVNGDVIKIKFIGSTIEVFRNGALQLTATSTVNLTHTIGGLMILTVGQVFDDWSFIGRDGAPKFERLNDGYLTDDRLTKVPMRTTHEKPEAFFELALADWSGTELIDTNDVPRLWISLAPDNYLLHFSPTNQQREWQGSFVFELWQGAPGTGVLVATRTSRETYGTNAASALRTPDTHLRNAYALTDAERNAITDPNALTARVTAYNDHGDTFAGLADATLPTGTGAVVLRHGGGATATAKGCTINAGRLRIAAGGLNVDGALLRSWRPWMDVFKRVKVKWVAADAGTTIFSFGIAAQGSVTHCRVVVVTATAIRVEDRLGNQGTETLLNTAATNVVGDAFEAVFNTDNTVTVYKNGALFGTSTASTRTLSTADHFRPEAWIKNESTAPLYFNDVYWGSLENNHEFYEIAYGLPTYDPSEAYIEQSDSGLVDEQATYEIAVEKTDTDSGLVDERTKLLTSTVGKLYPDAILAATGFPAGPVENIQDDPATPDTLVLSTGEVAGDLRASFQNPSGVRLVGEQKFRLRIREP